MPSLRNQSRDLLSSKNATMTNPRLVVLDLLLKENRPLTIDQVLKLSTEHKNNLGFISRRHVIDNFSKDRMLDNYLQFYKNTVL